MGNLSPVCCCVSMISAADSNMYGQLTTKNTFLDLPNTIGFDEDLTISGSSARRSSSSPPSYALCRLKKGLSPFELDDDAASTTTDDVSANSATDDRSSSCSEHQDLAEVTQTMPLKACAIQAESTSKKPSWSELQDSESEAQPPVQKLTGRKMVGVAITESKQSASPVCSQQQGVLEIPAAPAPEETRPWRRRQVPRQAEIEKQEIEQASPTIGEIGQLTSTRTRTVICYFHNRHLHHPDSYAACSKGGQCNFCHEMHPLIKRRNCQATGFCFCKKC